ncbi:hypothetical protein SI65_09941 [Aspergillus cristatus]|uniref:chitinase n=1 Tax=Aspergillus cristatus TaxID=573508 RepID=A0A1E3B2A9_ASPCR|nr:hypothetical protein SI65_09941 [Aspergillus cristatus]
MIPQSIPQSVYSHIYFAFGSIDPGTFEVIPTSEEDEVLYPQLQALQSRDLSQELWLSIGGWDFSDYDVPTATTFSDLGFTGVDIDWEYPAAGDRNGRAEDYNNFPGFLANLKKVLDEYKFGLSVTLPTSYWYLRHFDLVSIEPSVDWFNFMSYDLHGTWDIGNQWTGAYLDAHTNLTEIESALDLLWRNNITASKFLISAGVLYNNEIKQIISENDLNPTLYKDAAVKSITRNNDQWVSYDDQDTWKLKQSHILQRVAAALGNEINLDICTGLTSAVFSEKSTSDTSSSEKGQDQCCRFINCGEVCPSGFTEDITRPSVVSRGYMPDYRAQYRYSRTYAGGSRNTENMHDYDARTQALSSNIGGNNRWYVGIDRSDAINTLETTSRPTRASGYNYRQSTFSVSNLQYLFPTLSNYGGDGFPTPASLNARGIFNPKLGHSMRIGCLAAPDLSNADP